MKGVSGRGWGVWGHHSTHSAYLIWERKGGGTLPPSLLQCKKCFCQLN